MEGWTLLMTVETEVNGNSKGTNERGPSLVGSLGLLCRHKRFLFSLRCFNGKIKCPHRTLFQSLCPYCPARQPCWVACLLVCLWKRHCTYSLVYSTYIIFLCYSPFYFQSQHYIPKGNTCCWNRFFLCCFYYITY
jgi:hypothetical protein